MNEVKSMMETIGGARAEDAMDMDARAAGIQLQ